MKALKRLIPFATYCMLIAIMVNACFFVPDEPNPEPDEGDVWEKAADAVAGMKTGWNLGNTLDSYGDWIVQWGDGSTASFETAWGQPVTTPELMKAFAAAGFGAVRVPVTWRQHFNESDFTVDKAWMDRVEAVVGYVLDAGMYCIINLHHDTGTDGWLMADTSTYETSKIKFQALWKQIAERFEPYGEKLLFEGFNEILSATDNWTGPASSASYAIVNKLNQDFVSTVRSTGGNNAKRNLVCNTYGAGCSARELDPFVLPDDSAEGHLIAQVHSYAPYPFAFDVSSDTWWGPYDKKVFDKACEDAIREIIEGLDSHFVQKGIPCIIGEYGAVDKNNTPERAKHAAFYVSTARQYGITCFHWMGLMDGEDRSTLTWTDPEIRDAIIGSL